MSKIKSIEKEVKHIRVPLDGSVEIYSHPDQEDIYITDPDGGFIESVRTHGVREFPKVCKATDVFDSGIDNEEAICIISGHRRFAAARILGLQYIDCILESYDNKVDADLDHLISNNQRKKTHQEKAAEVKAYKQKLCQARKLYNSQGIDALKNFKSLDIGHYVREGNLDEFFNQDTFKIIEEKTGVSEKHQRQYNTIFNDEWLQDKISEISVNDRMSEKKKGIAVQSFTDLVHDARKAVDENSEISINKAYNEITRVWKQIEESMNPKEKKEKKKKTRKPKQEKFDFFGAFGDYKSKKVNVKRELYQQKVKDQEIKLLDSDDYGLILVNENEDELFTIDPYNLYKYIKSQK